MMGQPHKHAEFIKAKADGKNIQERRVIGEWHDMEEDDWIFDDNFEYRIKPEPPKYPQTRMTDSELGDYGGTMCGPSDMRQCANAAIARAIEDGQVVSMEQYAEDVAFQYQRGLGNGREDMVPAAMLEKVAEAVRAACAQQATKVFEQRANSIQLCTLPILVDCAAIIAKVKEEK